MFKNNLIFSYLLNAISVEWSTGPNKKFNEKNNDIVLRIDSSLFGSIFSGEIIIEICSEKRGELKTEIRSAKNLSNDEICGD